MNYETQYIRYMSAIRNKMNACQEFVWLQEHVENLTSNLVDTYPNGLWFCVEHIFSVDVLHMGCVKTMDANRHIRVTIEGTQTIPIAAPGAVCIYGMTA